AGLAAGRDRTPGRGVPRRRGTRRARGARPADPGARRDPGLRRGDPRAARRRTAAPGQRPPARGPRARGDHRRRRGPARVRDRDPGNHAGEAADGGRLPDRPDHLPDRAFAGPAQGGPLRAAERARRPDHRPGADAGGLHARAAGRGGRAVVLRPGGDRRAGTGVPRPAPRPPPPRLGHRRRSRRRTAGGAAVSWRVAGVDEAGCGPLAGPVVVAAVILDPHRPIDGLDDSKKLSPARREALYPQIIASAYAWRIEFVRVEEIDALNILQARLTGMRRALCALDPAATRARIDGNRLPADLPCRAEAVVGGDAQDPAI